MKKLLIAFLTLILILGGLYVGGLYYGSSHFLPKTTINGIDVSMKNVEEANEAMKDLSPRSCPSLNGTPTGILP